MWKKIIFIVIVLALGAGAWFWWNQEEEAQIVFSTVQMKKGDFINRVQSTGTLEPKELVPVGAQVTGEILELGLDTEGNTVDYGSQVKAGQLLARIDDTLVELAIQSSEASVEQAEANIASAKANITKSEASIIQAKANKEKANRNLERAKQLGVGEALSEATYDDYLASSENADAAYNSAIAQLDVSKATLKQSEAQLSSAKTNLAREMRNREYTRIKPPVDGTIIVRQVNIGETVVSSMSTSVLFLVARDLREMEIWASVNEVDIANIKKGQKVIYTVDAMPNEEFIGTVNKVRLNATMSSNVVTYIVEIDIANPELRLLPYMSANVNFIVDEQNDVMLVPDSAFEFSPRPSLINADAKAKMEERLAARGAGEAKGEGPARAKGEEGAARGKRKPMAQSDENIATIWKMAANETVAPVRVIRGESDGSHSVVTLLPGQELTEEDKLVTAVRYVSPEEGVKTGSNPFGMERPKKRERGTGQSK